VTTNHITADDVEDISAVHADTARFDDPAAAGADQPDLNAGDTENFEPATERRRGWPRRAMARWRLITVGLLLVASAGAAAGLYFGQYRLDQQTTETAAKGAISAASQGTVALLSYAPDSLDRDLSAAKSHLTGDFLTYYSKFTDQIVAPAAKQKAVKTTASVARAAVAELHPDSAKVLVFLNQTTTSRDRPDPSLTASTVMVSLTKTNGSWLISAFDPM
jgi:Mce-associated membrane protein